ncbi:hypothetical protein J2X32_003034 [Rheinheimera pacifica]|uniref:hypothetical protein n=1 Tax=Rheinheimera pacifica TaxID=173990 RepID=UPI00285FEAC4|nr:hypothetical protein [Rheinheimera pacifica]MDR6984390.1 hypothetical protein [Rheinheimera pacifica]
MLKISWEEIHAITKIIKGFSSLGKGPFWKRGVVYVIWSLIIIYIILKATNFLQTGAEKHWNQYLNSTGDISDRNSLMITKDAVNLCIAAVKNNHHYKKRYCDYSMLMFEQHTSRFDEFSQELVDAKAYEQIVISIDSDIRSLDFKALVKRHNKSLQEQVLDFLFTPLGMFFYFSIAIIILTLPWAVFYFGSKSKSKVRYLKRKQT